MGKHKNEDQDLALVRFMEENPQFANGYIRGERQLTDELWKTLVHELNLLGPPIKDCSTWKKTWIDWRIAIRRKLEKNSTACNNGVLILSHREHVIAKLCGFYESVEDKVNDEETSDYESNNKNSMKTMDSEEIISHTNEDKFVNALRSSTSSKSFSSHTPQGNIKGRHKNDEQDRAVIKFMQENPKFANGYIKGDRELTVKLWNVLVNKLNLLGPPMKDCSSWKKTWIDWRMGVRKKLEKKPTETDGVLFLSPKEDAIAKLCGYYETLEDTCDEPSDCETQSIDSEEDISFVDIPRSSCKKNSSSRLSLGNNKGIHKNEEQDHALLRFMADNPQMAKGYNKDERELHDALWKELIKELNNLGPPIKDVTTWKKAWGDWRTAVRRKLEKYPIETNPVLCLSSKEDMIAKICGLYEILDDNADKNNKGISDLENSMTFEWTASETFMEDSQEDTHVNPKRKASIENYRIKAEYKETPVAKKTKLDENETITLKNLSDTSNTIIQQQEAMSKCIDDLINVLRTNNAEIKEYHKAHLEELRRHHAVMENSSIYQKHES